MKMQITVSHFLFRYVENISIRDFVIKIQNINMKNECEGICAKYLFLMRKSFSIIMRYLVCDSLLSKIVLRILIKLMKIVVDILFSISATP